MSDTKVLEWTRRPRVQGDPSWYAELGGLQLWVHVPWTAWIWEWRITDEDGIEFAQGSMCVMENGEPVDDTNAAGEEWDYQDVELAQARCERVARAVLTTESTLPPAPETTDREHDPGEARKMATDWLAFDPKGGDGESPYERAKGNLARWALHCAGVREWLEGDVLASRMERDDYARAQDALSTELVETRGARDEWQAHAVEAAAKLRCSGGRPVVGTWDDRPADLERCIYADCKCKSAGDDDGDRQASQPLPAVDPARLFVKALADEPCREMAPCPKSGYTQEDWCDPCRARALAQPNELPSEEDRTNIHDDLPK